MLPAPDPFPDSVAADQLRWLRDVLRRDYLTRPDWQAALRDTAAMALGALAAREALVALFDQERGTWTAWTSGGERLSGDEISLAASLAVLEEVRQGDQPLLTTAERPLLLRSKSLLGHEVHSVLAVPLRFWDTDTASPRWAGCLYADRRAADRPFAAADVELVRDLAHLAERTLSLLSRLVMVERALAAAETEVTQVREAAATVHRFGHYESRDASFVREVLEPLAKAARAGKVGLLLEGPTGAGKSHLARAFHYASARRDGPFVTLDCGQVTSAEALGAELFGFSRRSGFSAPSEGRVGKARLAHRGTLFIDEVGALPLELQPRLLRLIQTGAFAPLGAAEEEHVDVQVIAAANQDLANLTAAGGFREDLLWRLSEITLRLPALDQRRADIPGFAERFLAAARERFGRPEIVAFTADALAALQAVPWSRLGNLRGLEHAVNRSVLLAPDGIRRLGVGELVLQAGAPGPAVTAAPPGAAAAPDSLALLLAAKLEEHGGNLTRVAGDADVRAALGSTGAVPPSTLRLRLRQLGLSGALAAARGANEPTLDAIRAAVRRHGSAVAAAAELGLSPHGLAWRLRSAGLTVRQLLAAGT